MQCDPWASADEPPPLTGVAVDVGESVIEQSKPESFMVVIECSNASLLAMSRFLLNLFRLADLVSSFVLVAVADFGVAALPPEQPGV
jgi:hypothetical protein